MQYKIVINYVGEYKHLQEYIGIKLVICNFL